MRKITIFFTPSLYSSMRILNKEMADGIFYPGGVVANCE
jgi:hypothetical protein